MVEQLRDVGLEATRDKVDIGYSARRAVFASVGAEIVRRHVGTVMTRRPLEIGQRAEQELLRDLVDAALGLWEYNLIQKIGAGTSSNIQVLGTEKIIIEHVSGKRSAVKSVFGSVKEMQEWVRRIARTFGSGESFDRAQPSVDLYLPPGVRFNAAFEENYGCVVSLRFTNFDIQSLKSLVQLGSLSLDEAAFLRACVLSRQNVVISGATNSGKTTLMRSMLAETPPFETIVTIEDSQELELNKFVGPEVAVFQMLEQQANIDGHGAVSSSFLFRSSLRMRPDRTVVGESRGPVVLEFLQAINSGQDGAMTTLHATGPQAMVTRMVRCADGEASHEAVVADIRTGLDFVVQVDRNEVTGKRYLTGIYQVDPTHEPEPRVRFTDIFSGDGSAPSRFVTNPVGSAARKLKAVGWEQPLAAVQPVMRSV